MSAPATPTAEDLLIAEVESLRATVKRVWDLHAPSRLGCITHYARTNCGCEPRQVCRDCGQAYPCPTLLALDGGGARTLIAHAPDVAELAERLDLVWAER